MSLVNLQPWILRAQREGFAIGAFNANTLEQVQAIVAAAQMENAPAIVQISVRALQFVGSGNETLGLKYMAEIGRVAAQSVDAPIALHLDHANEQQVAQAIALGFTSAMFDGGALSFAENIAVTQRLRAWAEANHVLLEAEVSAVPRPASGGTLDRAIEITQVQDAVEFARATQVDLLAIALGSVHAGKTKTVKLDLERLREIRAAVATPLVLHGSSGVLDEHIAQSIRRGIVKVNVATQLNQAFTQGARAVLDADAQEFDPRKYLASARRAMTERVRERIRFFGASGKA
jgi:fructose-bisphosphate aldolase class II